MIDIGYSDADLVYMQEVYDSLQRQSDDEIEALSEYLEERAEDMYHDYL